MPRMGAVAGDARDGSGFRHCGRIRCTDLLRILEGRAGGPGLGLSTCVLWAEGTHRAADAEKPRDCGRPLVAALGPMVDSPPNVRVTPKWQHRVVKSRTL